MRNAVPKPSAAFAENHWAVRLLAKPIAASRTSRPQRVQMKAASSFLMPVSMMLAMTSGTNNSKQASSILKSGANRACFS